MRAASRSHFFEQPLSDGGRCAASSIVACKLTQPLREHVFVIDLVVHVHTRLSASIDGTADSFLNSNSRARCSLDRTVPIGR